MDLDRFALPVTVRPIVGESGISFASRLADVNDCTLAGLLQDVAGRTRISGWGEAEWTRLAARSHLPSSALDGLKTPPADSQVRSAVTLLGHAVRETSLTSGKNLRLCPHCVGSRPVLRSVWRLAPWVACVEHGTYLVDTCDCGSGILESARGPDAFSCPCGQAFADIATRPASALAFDATRWLIQLIGPRLTMTEPDLWLDTKGRLDEPFSPFSEKRPMTLLDATAIIDTIGIGATTPTHLDNALPPSRAWQNGPRSGAQSIDNSIAHVEAAMRVLHDWPAGWHRVLEDVAGRNPETGDSEPKHLFATRVGRIVLTPFKASDGRPANVLVDETNRWLRSRGYTPRNKMATYHSDTARLLARSMNQREVARRLGITARRDEEMVRIYRQVVMEFDTRPDAPSNVTELGEAVFGKIAERYANVDDYRYRPEKCMASVPTAAFLSHPNGADTAEAWIHPDLLTPVNHMRRTVFRRESDVFDRDQVHAMRRRIGESSRQVEVNAIPDGYQAYRLAGRRVVEVDYTKTDLILDVLAGVVPTVHVVDEPRLSDLFIDVEAARNSARDSRYERMAIHDVHHGTRRCQEILDELWPGDGERITPTLSRALIEAGEIGREVRNRPTEGRVKPYNFYSVRDHMVRRFRRNGPTGLGKLDATLGRLVAGVEHCAACRVNPAHPAI